MKRVLLLVSVMSLVLLETGCVTGRRTVPLPIQSVEKAAATKGAVRIESVTDSRRFENRPSSPSIPSVDGDVTALTNEQKGAMIGRQRNTYGKAMGDVALPKGESVTERARLLVEAALKQHGYTITDDSSAPVAATVSVDEFWGWGTPGMFTISFEARVSCSLALQKGSDPVTVTITGYGMNHAQVARDANWQLAYDRAFKDFLQKAGPALEKAGL